MSADALIERLCALRSQCDSDPTVLIVTQRPGRIGGAAGVPVTSVQAGFDWSHGKLLLSTAHPLTELTPEQVTDIVASVRQGQSWHAYQAHKKQAARIEALEAEVARLRRLVGGVTAGEPS